MYETLKMMEQLLIGNEKERSEKELIEEYYIHKSPNILAYMYISNFGIIQDISKRYIQLDDADKASFCLQELDKCLLTFDNSLNVKFITYFAKCLRNNYRMETEAINTQKRKILYNTIGLETENDSSYPIFDDYFNFNQFAKECRFTEREKKQCLLINNGYKLYEIASIFNTSIALINKTNKIIKQKILNYCTDF